MNRPPEAKIANRSIKKHQRRLSSGAATRIPYPGLSDALVGATASFIEATVNNSKLSDLSELMTMKCDVCVLSEYNQVFRLLDGILEADMVNVKRLHSKMIPTMTFFFFFLVEFESLHM